MKTDPVSDNLKETQIVLLQKALEYYADIENYKSGNIMKDSGHIAKHSLGLVKSVNDQIAATKESYEKTIQKIGEDYLSELDGSLNTISEGEVESLQKLDIILSKINEASREN